MVRGRLRQAEILVSGRPVAAHRQAVALLPGDIISLADGRAQLAVQLANEHVPTPTQLAVARYCSHVPPPAEGSSHSSIPAGLGSAAPATAAAAAAEAAALARIHRLARSQPAAAEVQLAQLAAASPLSPGPWFVWAQIAQGLRRTHQARDLYRTAHHCCTAALTAAVAGGGLADASTTGSALPARLAQVLSAWARLEWEQKLFGPARRLWRAGANAALCQPRPAAAASVGIVLHAWAVAEYSRDNVRNARIVIAEALRKCPNDAAVSGREAG